MKTVITMLAAAATLVAQTNGSFPENRPNHSRVADVRQIVTASIAATQRHWEARLKYSYMERDESRRRDLTGRVKSENVDVSRTILINGVPYEQLVERNGRPPSAEEGRKHKEKLDKLKRETPEQRAERLRRQEKEIMSIVREVPEAFDFQLRGEEVVNARPAYVLQATPHPGYYAKGKYGKMFFGKVEGKLWIDKQDLGWIKVDAQVIQTVLDGTVSGARAARLTHYDGTDARRQWGLDAGTHRSASDRQNLFREKSHARSGPDLLRIQAGRSLACPDRRSREGGRQKGNMDLLSEHRAMLADVRYEVSVMKRVLVGLLTSADVIEERRQSEFAEKRLSRERFSA
jgi:hypothetical protein